MNWGALDKEIFGMVECEDSDHIVYFGTPWGQILWVHFDAAQWEMLNTIAKLDNLEISQVLEEIVEVRFNTD